jgi:hypothetical protein
LPAGDVGGRIYAGVAMSIAIVVNPINCICYNRNTHSRGFVRKVGRRQLRQVVAIAAAGVEPGDVVEILELRDLENAERFSIAPLRSSGRQAKKNAPAG